MTTLHFPHWAKSAKSVSDRVRPVEVREVLLWAGAALGTCAVVFMLVLGPGKAMFREAVSLELAPSSNGMLLQGWTASAAAIEDSFHQKKLDAKAEELPAQF